MFVRPYDKKDFLYKAFCGLFEKVSTAAAVVSLSPFLIDCETRC